MMSFHKSLVFFLFIVSGECYLIESFNFSRQVDLVDSLNITNLDDESSSSFMLNDKYPVFFKCSFKLDHKSFEIVFRRTKLRQPSNILRNLFFYYESDLVKVNSSSFKYQANSILFRHLRSSNSTNDTNYDIILTLLEIESNDDVLVSIIEIRLDRLSESSNDALAYKAFRGLPKLPEDKLKYRRHIAEPSSTKKLELMVEACVHFEYSAFRRVKEFFSSEKLDFIRIYLASYLSSKVSAVNKIYQSFEHSRFKIDVILTDLVIHESFESTDNIHLNASGSRDLFRRANEFISKYLTRTNKTDKCDHVFYIHGNIFNESTLGLCYLKDVCQLNSMTSLIMNIKNEPLELVMAHELAHNLGADHDTYRIMRDERCEYDDFNLMRPSLDTSFSTYLLSHCSVVQITRTLFEQVGNFTVQLKPKYLCLIKKNEHHNKVDYYSKLVKNKYPGFYYSLSDQCRLLNENKNSYACDFRKDICDGIYCADSENRCSIRNVPLDGTKCSRNASHYCLFTECVDTSKKKAPASPNDTKSLGNLYKDDLKRESIYLFYSLNEKNQMLAKASKTLIEVCPNGATQESRILSSSMKPHDTTNPFFRYNSCELFLDSRRETRLQWTCNGDFAEAVCCEQCIKYKYNKCPFRFTSGKPFDCVDGNDSSEKCKSACKLPTCENLAPLNPCYNGGTCVTNAFKVKHQNSNVLFDCACPKGFKGPLCLNFDACAFDPCQENEICYDLGELGVYECLCPPDFNEYPFCKSEMNYFTNDERYLRNRRYFLRKLLNIIILISFILLLSYSLGRLIK